MRARYGTIEAIKRLVVSGEIQSGFKRLKALNRLQWSLEQCVLEFKDHFDKPTVECAKWRLWALERIAS